jgi:hypothetical protein
LRPCRGPVHQLSSVRTESGVLPEGGVYSGPGVEDGFFHPDVAGIGTHTIIYTYADTNTAARALAEQTVVVDVCAGIPENNNLQITALPNPDTGSFRLGAVRVRKKR